MSSFVLNNGAVSSGEEDDEVFIQSKLDLVRDDLSADYPNDEEDSSTKPEMEIKFLNEFLPSPSPRNEDDAIIFSVFFAGKNFGLLGLFEPDISRLNWPEFKSYIFSVLNLDYTDDCSVAYSDEDGGEKIPIEREKEYQEVLKIAKQKASINQKLVLHITPPVRSFPNSLRSLASSIKRVNFSGSRGSQGSMNMPNTKDMNTSPIDLSYTSGWRPNQTPYLEPLEKWVKVGKEQSIESTPKRLSSRTNKEEMAYDFIESEQRSTNSSLSSSFAHISTPPNWFTGYMEQFKVDLSNEISNKVEEKLAELIGGLNASEVEVKLRGLLSEYNSLAQEKVICCCKAPGICTENNDHAPTIDENPCSSKQNDSDMSQTSNLIRKSMDGELTGTVKRRKRTSISRSRSSTQEKRKKKTENIDTFLRSLHKREQELLKYMDKTNEKLKKKIQMKHHLQKTYSNEVRDHQFSIQERERVLARIEGVRKRHDQTIAVLGKLHKLMRKDQGRLSMAGTYGSSTSIEGERIKQSQDNSENVINWDTHPWVRNKDYNAKLLEETIYPDDALLSPGDYFCKTWLVLNNGRKPWDENVTLKCISLTDLRPVCFKTPWSEVPPGKTWACTVEFIAPSKTGRYKAQFSFQHEKQYFGELLYASIHVTTDKHDRQLISQSFIKPIWNFRLIHEDLLLLGKYYPYEFYMMTWKVENTGKMSWDKDTKLMQYGVDPMELVTFPNLLPGERGTISIRIKTSVQNRSCEYIIFRLQQKNKKFGPPLFLHLNVGYWNKCSEERSKSYDVIPQEKMKWPLSQYEQIRAVSPSVVQKKYLECQEVPTLLTIVDEPHPEPDLENESSSEEHTGPYLRRGNVEDASYKKCADELENTEEKINETFQDEEFEKTGELSEDEGESEVGDIDDIDDKEEEYEWEGEGNDEEEDSDEEENDIDEETEEEDVNEKVIKNIKEEILTPQHAEPVDFSEQDVKELSSAEDEDSEEGLSDTDDDTEDEDRNNSEGISKHYLYPQHKGQMESPTIFAEAMCQNEMTKKHTADFLEHPEQYTKEIYPLEYEDNEELETDSEEEETDSEEESDYEDTDEIGVKSDINTGEEEDAQPGIHKTTTTPSMMSKGLEHFGVRSVLSKASTAESVNNSKHNKKEISSLQEAYQQNVEVKLDFEVFPKSAIKVSGNTTELKEKKKNSLTFEEKHFMVSNLPPPDRVTSSAAILPPHDSDDDSFDDMVFVTLPDKTKTPTSSVAPSREESIAEDSRIDSEVDENETQEDSFNNSFCSSYSEIDSALEELHNEESSVVSDNEEMGTSDQCSKSPSSTSPDPVASIYYETHNKSEKESEETAKGEVNDTITGVMQLTSPDMKSEGTGPSTTPTLKEGATTSSESFEPIDIPPQENSDANSPFKPLNSLNRQNQADTIQKKESC